MVVSIACHDCHLQIFWLLIFLVCRIINLYPLNDYIAPGTGKTTTAVEIMLQILKRSKHRILVCAETNLAVDNLALRFLHECDQK